MLVPGVPDRNVAVRYRGAASPQLVDVSFVAAGEVAPEIVQAWAFQMVSDVSFGGAGGDLFHPGAGAASIVQQRVEGRRGDIRFELAGVAPLFLRTLIESLAMKTSGLETVIVQGALPPIADDPASVQSDDVLRWLSAGRDYLPRWPAPGFPIAPGDASGLALRVRAKDAFDDATGKALVDLIYVWRAQISEYADDSGAFPVDLALRFPVLWPWFGRGTREMRALFDELPHAHGPSVAVLVNMLCRFHAVAPIYECEIKS